MENWGEISKSLMRYMRLRSSPVAVKLVENEKEFPRDMIRASDEIDAKVAVCQVMGMARSGQTIGMSSNESSCIVATTLFGWGELIDEMKLMERYYELGEGSMEGVRRMWEALPRLEKGRYGGLVMSALETTFFDPDVILIYCNPAQANVLVHGSLFMRGGNLTFSTQASAVCAEAIIPTFLEKKSTMALPCGGDRKYEMTQDDTLIFGVWPGSLHDILHGIKTRYEKGGAEYPYKTQLVFKPQHLPYKGLEKYLRYI